MKTYLLTALALAIGLVLPVTAHAAAKASNKVIDFTLTDTTGNAVKLSDYRGKVVVIDAWATWCPACVAEIPNLIKAQAALTKDKAPAVLLGVSVDRDRNAVKRFVKDNKVNYPVVYADNKALELLGDFEYIPTKFVIDPEGKVREAVEGSMSVADLKALIAKYTPKEKDKAKEKK